MFHLQFVTVLLAISCGLVRAGGAGGPPPMPPTPPPNTTPIPGCSHDPACEITYTADVVQGDACQAAEAYLVCAKTMNASCGQSAVPSNVIGILNHAAEAVAEKCNAGTVTEPTLPDCVSTECKSYGSTALAQYASNLTSQACSSSKQFLKCLQEFIDTGFCDVTSQRNAAQTLSAQQCGGNNGTNTGNGDENGSSRIAYISNLLLLFSMMVWTA